MLRFPKSVLSGRAIVATLALAIAACGEANIAAEQPLIPTITIVGMKPTSVFVLIEFNKTDVHFDALLEEAPPRQITREAKNQVNVWAISDLEPGTTYLVHVIATDKDNQRSEAWKDFETPFLPEPEKPREDKLSFGVLKLESVTSRINRLVFRSSKLVMVELFYVDGQYESQAGTFRGINQTGPEEFEILYWSSWRAPSQVVLYAWTEEGEAVRVSDLTLGGLPAEITTSVVELTATTVLLGWASIDVGRTFDYIWVSCNTPGWSSSGSSDPRDNVASGAVYLTSLKPGSVYQCGAYGNDHELNLPIRSEEFVLTTPN